MALAAVTESDERLVEELADLWFHSYVLLAARGLQPTRDRGRAAAPPSRRRACSGAGPGSGRVRSSDRSRDRHRARRAPRAARASARAPCGQGAHRSRRLRPELRPVPDALLVSRDGAPGRVRREPGWGDRRLRAGVRGRPRARGERLRPRRAVSRVSREPSTRCGSSRACSPRWGSRARSPRTQDGYPGILGYQGPSLSAR